ncbi:hypothetical protein F383_22026 [Gossypium arboreum]|uniref:Uncharacterized protein n=1 Tax=Gossypium arboreum TaxID=29729 RepID=A0A0B0NRH3_GOSAR|nr:hypothetical protein F383_22026 [Gossypium arboreum]
MTCHLYPNLFLRFDWDFSLANNNVEGVRKVIYTIHEVLK